MVHVPDLITAWAEEESIVTRLVHTVGRSEDGTAKLSPGAGAEGVRSRELKPAEAVSGSCTARGREDNPGASAVIKSSGSFVYITTYLLPRESGSRYFDRIADRCGASHLGDPETLEGSIPTREYEITVASE